MDEFNGDQTPASLWLSYSLTRSITAALRRKLLQAYPDPADLAALLSSTNPHVKTGDEQFNQAAASALAERDTQSVRKKLELAIAWQHSQADHHIVGLDHPAYPRALLATTDAPPVLYVKGELECLNTPSVAIVGARKASHNALEQARQIAQELTEHGITVVSGMALGVDAAAHQGALHGGGQTIAVSATGPNQIYPRTHAKLADAIQSNGAVITEFPLGSKLQPHCFPRRNRIISGISLGVLVVEAALPSGTLTTAQHALKQGREVMAMPGSVNNPLTHGCHELIKNGAALVERANDVLLCLQTELECHITDTPDSKTNANKMNNENKLPGMEPETLTLLNCLGFDPVSIDTLVRRSGLDAARVAVALTHLELSGVIVTDNGGRYTRCKQSAEHPV